MDDLPCNIMRELRLGRGVTVYDARLYLATTRSEMDTTAPTDDARWIEAAAAANGTSPNRLARSQADGRGSISGECPLAHSIEG